MSTTRRSGGGRRLVADRRANPAKPAPRRASAGSGGGSARKAHRKGARQRGVLARVLGFLFGLIWALVWRSAAVIALLVFVATAYIYATLPPIDEAADARIRGSVTFLDRDGEVFARRGAQYGGAADSTAISSNLVDALIATEDRRFYWHPGVDPIGIGNAIRINISEGRGPFSGHGGSTIAMQVAKLMCLGVPFDATTWESEADCRRTTLWRKVQEVPWALALTGRYGRDGVVSVYLNRAYFGAGAYGVTAAMERYFGTTPDLATPQQAAMLAGLLTAPSRFAPTNDLERSQGRAGVVLGLMHRSGYLSDAELADARAAPATLSPGAVSDRGGAFADWVMAAGPDFLTGETTEDVVIRSTFDPEIQAAAEAAVDVIFADRVSEGSGAQAAVVVMSADGAVRAMVGGRDIPGERNFFNRAVQAQRQPGSSFKPFIYAAALDQGWRYDDLIYDGPLTIDVPGSGPYSPANYTGEFYGEIMLIDALRSSLNTAAVRLSETVGRDEVARVAEGFGIDANLRELGPAIALGASEVTLLEMVGAYAGILSGGYAVTPYAVEELQLGGSDEPLYQAPAGGGFGEQVISAQAAGQLVYMMNQVVENGTGQNARFGGWQIAGKTGTTNSARDAWFVAFTADYVAGVWMGYDDNTPLRGVTGGGLPSEIWRETMAPIHAGLDPLPLPMIDPADMPRAVPQTQTDQPDLGQQILMEVLQQVLSDLDQR
ncbi:MAG: transglycosylase domain-containing protein [Pseudomonadota bacterium]